MTAQQYLCRRHLPAFSTCHRCRWGHLKTPTRPDNSPCKYFAFLNVCHFLEAFSAPEKITLQVCHERCCAGCAVLNSSFSVVSCLRSNAAPHDVICGRQYPASAPAVRTHGAMQANGVARTFVSYSGRQGLT